MGNFGRYKIYLIIAMEVNGHLQGDNVLVKNVVILLTGLCDIDDNFNLSTL